MISALPDVGAVGEGYGKLEVLEGKLGRKFGKGSEDRNVFVIKGLNEIEVKVHGSWLRRRGFQAQDEAEAGGLRGREQQEIVEGVEGCLQVHHEVGQDEDMKEDRERRGWLCQSSHCCNK